MRKARLTLAILAIAAATFVVAVVIAATRSIAPPPIPLPGTGTVPRAGDPFAYISSRRADFAARAIAGSEQVLFTKSPGGILATAARVARFRGLIDAATAGTNIDPNLLEGLVFVESAGLPNAIAGTDPADASGLTQILAQTGQVLLGMRIDLPRSRALSAAIERASLLGRPATVARLERERARIDDRFDPAKDLAGAVRYLKIAEHDLGRLDLAVVAYHMGIGNLQQVLDAYDGGHSVPYVQLYFDTAPDHHRAAYALLSGFGDDSSLYYWRVLGAEQVMARYRHDRAALVRLNSLQTTFGSTALVLHPPERTQPFADPDQLDYAYANRTIVPLPSNAAALGLAYYPYMGSLAAQLHVKAALYRGLRPAALDLLIELASRVRALSGGLGPLVVTSTVTDERYQRLLGVSDPPAAAGWTFTIARQYVGPAQAEAFQAMLDRLQALNLIGWERYPSEIEVTVASDASRVIADGP